MCSPTSGTPPNPVPVCILRKRSCAIWYAVLGSATYFTSAASFATLFR